MEEYNDKSKTMEFTPMHKEKPQVERTENSIYSQARRSTPQHSSRRKKDNTTKILAITSVVLSVLIILVVVVAILVINMENLKRNDEPSIENPPLESVFEEEEEELPPEEEINDYSLVFCSDSVMEEGEAYVVLADLYDSDLQNKENRKLYITAETKIRQGGKRLSAEGLIYAVERMAGEGTVFDAQIRENDSVIISISYDGNLEEELGDVSQEEEEGVEVEEIEEVTEETVEQESENGVVIE